MLVLLDNLFSVFMRFRRFQLVQDFVDPQYESTIEVISPV